MAEPGRAPQTAVHPVDIHWTQQQGWWITPNSNSIPLNDKVRFNTDTNCTVHFSPTDTVFGASHDINAGTPWDVDVGTVNCTVNMCANAQGGTACSPDARIKDTPMSTIIVGSGGRPGRK